MSDSGNTGTDGSKPKIILPGGDQSAKPKLATPAQEKKMGKFLVQITPEEMIRVAERFKKYCGRGKMAVEMVLIQCGDEPCLIFFKDPQEYSPK